jgi:phosphoribosylglycinamide formyltransferase-1
MMKIGFLASHRGSNMLAVLEAMARGELLAHPAALVCNNRGAEAAALARARGVPVYILNATTHPEEEALDEAIRAALLERQCDLVVLAGYMKKLGPKVLAAFGGRIINIHPSLLPKHGGQGMYGQLVHRAVLEAGDAVTGVSIHLVNGEYDQGRILAQAEVPVLAGDTVESLAQRVLACEHRFLPETLGRIIGGKLAL